MNFIGVVLAGGNSTRMGQDKSGLMRLEQTMLSYTQSLLHKAGAETVLVSSKLGASYGIADKYSNCGPLAGIEAVLSNQAPNTWCLFCPVDLPLIDHNVLVELATYANEKHTAAHFKCQPLPLIVQASSRNLMLLRQLLEQAQNLSIRHFVNQINATELATKPEQNWLNTNTPEQWQLALKQLN